MNPSPPSATLSLSKTVHTLERYQRGMTRHANVLRDGSRVPPRYRSPLPVAAHSLREAAEINADLRCLRFFLSALTKPTLHILGPSSLTGVLAANLRKAGFTPKNPAAKESNWGGPYASAFFKHSRSKEVLEIMNRSY